MISEDAILSYLTIDGKVFIAPQYAYGGCPDFVALDFARREILVVEFTDAADWKPLATRITDRTGRWFQPLRLQLERDRVVDASWSGPRFLGFVRESLIPGLEACFAADEDVTFFSCEQACSLWRSGEARIATGLPDRRLKGSAEPRPSTASRPAVRGEPGPRPQTRLWPADGLTSGIV